jgi:inner membrane protein involved in colicin E2 resistance
MLKSIPAIVAIFVCASVAWIILGETVFSRTYSSDATLENRVAALWGAPQNQTPPTAYCDKLVPKTVETVENGRKKVRIEQDKVTVFLPLEASNIKVDLDLDHRQKGLLWYSTYKVGFEGLYTFRNTTSQDKITFALKFPTTQAIYDDLVFTVDDTPVTLSNAENTATGIVNVAPGTAARLKVAYRSQGLTDWRYSFGEHVAQVRDFSLSMTTNFKDIDFPENSLSPSQKTESARGWELVWNYKNLLSGIQIGMVMPEKLQPGPIAGRISFFAPVSLLFFFFLMFIITTMRGIELHPMNYFFLAAAFFSFHLLLAYLVDQVSIHVAFGIASMVSILLVISYLRLVTGMRFAAREAGLAQFIYLVMFSYAFFFKGITGLAITIGSVLTLFVVMQITGRVRWAERFAAKPSGLGETTP